MNTPKTTFVLTLEAVGSDDRPAEIRLKALLKYAWRATRLRCVRLMSEPDERVPTDLETK